MNTTNKAQFQENLLKLADQIDEQDHVQDDIDKDIEKVSGENTEPGNVEEAERQKVVDFVLENSDLTQEQFDQWKETYGKVFVAYFDKDEFYCFRSVLRIEYKDIIKRLAKAKAATSQEQKDLYDEMLVEKCLLYPVYTVEFKNTSAAGTIETLSKQIEASSNFLPDDIVLRLITKI